MNETCEGYVVNRLKETEKENECLTKRFEVLKEENNKLSATLIASKDILSRRA
jgi:hypothetical protein